MHSHEFTEIAFVACGYARHTHISHNGGIYQEGLVQGDLFSVLPGEMHGYEHCKNMVLYNIYFDAAVLNHFIHLHTMPNWKILLHERTDLEMKKLHLSGGQLSRAVQCLDHAIREANLRQDGFETVTVALFLEFLNRNNALFRNGQKIISDGALVAITLMIAESDPKEKDIMTTMVMNLLMV